MSVIHRTLEPVTVSPRLADPLIREALDGLRATPKTLPCKLLYDDAGSKLFDEICDLPEYYPTRTELDITEQYADQLARFVGDHAHLIELGSGSSTKTPLLLDRLPTLSSYTPIDISENHLADAARRIQHRYPQLYVDPVVADYCDDWSIPESPKPPARRVAYFPGSTIGNFDPDHARAFLDDLAHKLGPDGRLVIGVDLKKSPDVLIPAYDDAQGTTAAFNFNLLVRLNREADADFDLDAFTHEARWNETLGRIEMHLVSRRDHVVRVAGQKIHFRRGETIHTESSHKHTLEGFAELASAFEIHEVLTDDAGLFSVQCLSVRESA
ncbi:MAG: L-histidine N(alpha)-methyltransferase [Planctomycetota bacterium]